MSYTFLILPSTGNLLVTQRAAAVLGGLSSGVAQLLSLIALIAELRGEAALAAVVCKAVSRE